MYASSYRDAAPQIKSYARKDVAFYLDAEAWGRLMDAAPPDYSAEAGDVPALDDATGRCYIVDWTDMSGLPQPRFEALLNMAIQSLEAGKSVEVGCIGAHGRTGTFLAGLLVKLEGLPGDEARAEIRRRYCESAVEVEKQCEMLRILAGDA